MKRVINPQTGRSIKVGGSTWKKLRSMTETKSRNIPLHRPLTVKQLLATKQPDYIRSRLLNMKDISNSPTGGWVAMAPKHGAERHQLIKKCGSTCFLRPENEGFPICPKLTMSNGQCQLSCKGLHAAYNRAQQWKYPSIASEAKNLLRTRC